LLPLNRAGFEDLERDRSPEGQLLSEIDAAHAAARDESNHPIPTRYGHADQRVRVNARVLAPGRSV
jgi:hypothetical protein